MLLFLLACGGTSIEERPCPPGGTTLTYESFGRPFLDQWCQHCHGASSHDRHGAPSSYTFGSREEVLRHKARIFARAADDNRSMPTGPDGPSDEARTRLGEWLACGAP
jgi:uncharacterized membrane protein